MSTDATGPKALFLLDGPIKTPPFSEVARREVGLLLRVLQEGDSLIMPQSRPMPSIGPRVHELRVRDESANWRLIYRIDFDAIIVVLMFSKKTRQTPKEAIRLAQGRLKDFDARLRQGG